MEPDYVSPRTISEKYAAHSGRVSENIRVFGFGALALVWIIADQKLERLSGTLLWACGLVVGVFVADLLQYIWLAEGFRWLGTKGKKVEGENGVLVEAPRAIRLGGEFLFWLKIVLLLGAFTAIVVALLQYRPPTPVASPCSVPPGPKL